MEQQKTQNRQSNPEKQKSSRRHNSSGLQAMLQSHSHQNSVELVPKQTDRPMEQKREPRNKPSHLWSISLTKEARTSNGKKTDFSESGAGKPG